MNRNMNTGFTLVELLAVTVMLSLAMGMVALSLNGVTRKGRLTAAMRQTASFDQTARVQALAEGRPRRLEFARDSSRIRLQVNEPVAGRWRWSLGSDLRLVHGPRIEAVTCPDRIESIGGASGPWQVTINSDGTSVSYAVKFGPTSEPNSAPTLVIEGVTGQSRMVWDQALIPSALDEMSLGSCETASAL